MKTISDLGADNPPTTLYITFFIITFGYLMTKFAVLQKFGITYSNKKSKWKHTPSYATYTSISYVVILITVQILVLLFDNLQKHCGGYVSNKNIISILISSVTSWGLIFSTTFFTINFLPLDWKSVFGNTIGYEISSRLYGIEKYETFFQKILNDPNDPALKKKDGKLSKSLVDLLNTLLDKRYKNIKHFVNGMNVDKFTQFINISIYEKIIRDIPDDIIEKAKIPKENEDELDDKSKRIIRKGQDIKVANSMINALGDDAEPIKMDDDKTGAPTAPAAEEAAAAAPAAEEAAAAAPAAEAAANTPSTNKEDIKGGANNELNNLSIPDISMELKEIEEKTGEPLSPELIKKINEITENINRIESLRTDKTTELLKLQNDNDSFEGDINELRTRIERLQKLDEDNKKAALQLEESNEDILSDEQEFEDELNQDILSEESELYNLITKLYKVILLKDLFGEFMWISLAGLLTILITYTKVLEEKCSVKGDSVFGPINKIFTSIGIPMGEYDNTKSQAEMQADAYNAAMSEIETQNQSGTKQFNEIDNRFTENNPENFALLKEDSNFNNTRKFNKKIQDNSFWKATKDPSSLELGEYSKYTAKKEAKDIKKRMRTQGVPFLTQQFNI